MSQSVQDKLAQISYSDGHVDQVQLISDQANLVFRDWREQVWHLRFRGVVLFQSYEFGGDVSEVRVGDDAALQEALEVIKQNGGKREGYPGLVSVSFLCDAPMITLVFQDLDVEGPVSRNAGS